MKKESLSPPAKKWFICSLISGFPNNKTERTYSTSFAAKPSVSTLLNMGDKQAKFAYHLVVYENEMFFSVNVICYIIINSFYHEDNKTYIHLIIEISLSYLSFRNAVLVAFLTNDWICGTICLFVILKGHRLRINRGGNFDALCIEYYKFKFLNIKVLRYLNTYISKIINHFRRCTVKPLKSI